MHNKTQIHVLLVPFFCVLYPECHKSGTYQKKNFCSLRSQHFLYPILKIVAPLMDLDVTPPLSDPAYVYGVHVLSTHYVYQVIRKSGHTSTHAYNFAEYWHIFRNPTISRLVFNVRKLTLFKTVTELFKIKMNYSDYTNSKSLARMQVWRLSPASLLCLRPQ